MAQEVEWVRRLDSAVRTIPGWAVALGVTVAGIAGMAALFGRPALQAVVLGAVAGSIYVVGASGLSLLYGIKKFANFAHGDLMTVGAFVAFALTDLVRGAGLHMVVGIAGAIVAVALVGIVLELLIFRRLEGRGVVAPLVASIGVALVLQNLIIAIFGAEPVQLNISIPQDVSLGFGVSINPIKGGVTIGTAVGLVVFLHVLLRRTTLGKAMRACADDLDLARTSGINTRNVVLWSWAISGALAAVAGILLAIAVNLTPYVGFFFLLFIFAAVIVGGIGHPYGAMLGGLIVGLVQKESAVVLNVSQTVGLPILGVVVGVLAVLGFGGALVVLAAPSRSRIVALAGIAALAGGASLVGWIVGWEAALGVLRIEGGSAYEPAGAFLAMIVVLLIRPQGIVGVQRERFGGRVATRARRVPGG